MDKLRVADAITEVFTICSNAATNISTRQMPWVLAKDEAKKDRLATVLYNLMEGITLVQAAPESVYAGHNREDSGAVEYKKD